jgi:hypothetical protein
VSEPEPCIEIGVAGIFPGKSAEEVLDFITDALHDWLNPGLAEGEECVCQFAGMARPCEEGE